MNATTLTGLLLITISTLLYGAANPLVKKAGLSPCATLFVHLGISWLIGLPFFLATGAYHELGNTKGVGMLAIVGVMTGIGYLLGIAALMRLPVWLNGLFLVFWPVLNAVFAWFLLHEPISPKFIIAFAFMSVGLLIAVL